MEGPVLFFLEAPAEAGPPRLSFGEQLGRRIDRYPPHPKSETLSVWPRSA